MKEVRIGRLITWVILIAFFSWVLVLRFVHAWAADTASSERCEQIAFQRAQGIAGMRKPVEDLDRQLRERLKDIPTGDNAELSQREKEAAAIRDLAARTHVSVTVDQRVQMAATPPPASTPSPNPSAPQCADLTPITESSPLPRKEIATVIEVRGTANAVLHFAYGVGSLPLPLSHTTAVFSGQSPQLDAKFSGVVPLVPDVPVPVGVVPTPSASLKVGQR